MIELYPLTLHRGDGHFKAMLGFCDAAASWLISCQEQYLHQQELTYVEEQRVQKTKEDFLRSRYVVKKALSAFNLKEKLSDIYIQKGVFQQPILSSSLNYQVGVSITHSVLLAACLIFPEAHPMSLDLEKIREGNENHIASQTTESEKRLYSSLYENEPSFYTRIWTIKEALSKVLKTGMMACWSVFEIETILYQPHYTISLFRNFHQYKAISFHKMDTICTIVLPKESSISMDALLLILKM